MNYTRWNALWFCLILAGFTFTIDCPNYCDRNLVPWHNALFHSQLIISFYEPTTLSFLNWLWFLIFYILQVNKKKLRARVYQCESKQRVMCMILNFIMRWVERKQSFVCASTSVGSHTDFTIQQCIEEINMPQILEPSCTEPHSIPMESNSDPNDLRYRDSVNVLSLPLLPMLWCRVSLSSHICTLYGSNWSVGAH